MKVGEEVYSHLVLDLGQRCVGSGSSLELVLDHDVEVSVVDLVGSAIEGSGDDLTLGDGEGFGGVKDGLLESSEEEGEKGQLGCSSERMRREREREKLRRTFQWRRSDVEERAPRASKAS